MSETELVESGECFIGKTIETRGCSDGAFMGTTHALSAVALFLAVTAFMPATMYQVLGTDDIWIVVLSMMVMAGGALIPDLDNSASTAKSSLGYLGDALSVFFRVSSSFIQTTIRTPRDDSTPNPHRGFYHTPVAAFLIGLLVFLGTRITAPAFTLPVIGAATWGLIVALVVTWLCTHMAFAALAKKLIRSIKNASGAFGELVVFAFSLALTFIIFTQLPEGLDYWWLGVSVGVGVYTHSFGDAFTTAGSPILWPIPRKGKLWYNYRFLKIKAGGVIENSIFVPFFTLVIVVSFLKISGLLGILS
jgi:membrane-bound metal-dependent hydrolase YbcI (DUF457 family)